jgi:phosphohistidine phosphatase
MNGSSMKHLILLRHASAENGDLDRARAISATGRGEAARMAVVLERLAGQGFRPALLLCSPARRARETLDALRDALGDAARVEEDEALYLASAGRLLAKLQALPDLQSQVLLVGHNPGLVELVQLLVERGAADVLLRASRGLAPGALAALRITTPRWRELAPGCAELVEFLCPADVVDEADRADEKVSR